MMRPAPKVPSLLERIRARGLRLTWQRRLLAKLLDEAREHLDAEGVFRLARAKNPAIHRSTVYRTLKTLKQAGLVDELDLMHVTGERHFYEVRPSRLHIHVVCLSCGQVLEPGGPFWEELERRVRRETGFEPEMVRLEVGGRCPRCARASHRRGRTRREPQKNT